MKERLSQGGENFQKAIALVVLAALFGAGLYGMAQSRDKRDKLIADCGADMSRCTVTTEQVLVGLFSGQPSIVDVNVYSTFTPTPTENP